MLSQSLARNVLEPGAGALDPREEVEVAVLGGLPRSMFSLLPSMPCLSSHTPLAIDDQPTSLSVSVSGP